MRTLINPTASNPAPFTVEDLENLVDAFAAKFKEHFGFEKDVEVRMSGLIYKEPIPKEGNGSDFFEGEDISFLEGQLDRIASVTIGFVEQGRLGQLPFTNHGEIRINGESDTGITRVEYRAQTIQGHTVSNDWELELPNMQQLDDVRPDTILAF